MKRAIFKVQDVFFIEGVGTIASGQLIDGVAEKGMKAIINGKESAIISIEAHNKSLDQLTTGVQGAMILSNVKKSDLQIGANYTFN